MAYSGCVRVCIFGCLLCGSWVACPVRCCGLTGSCGQAGDVRRALRMLNMPSNDASLKYFLKKLDKNHDNVVSYAEFAAFVMLHDEALNKVWRTFHDDTHPNPNTPQQKYASEER